MARYVFGRAYRWCFTSDSKEHKDSVPIRLKGAPRFVLSYLSWGYFNRCGNVCTIGKVRYQALSACYCPWPLIEMVLCSALSLMCMFCLEITGNHIIDSLSLIETSSLGADSQDCATYQFPSVEHDIPWSCVTMRPTKVAWT